MSAGKQGEFVMNEEAKRYAVYAIVGVVAIGLAFILPI